MSFFFDAESSCRGKDHFFENVLLKYHAEATSSRICIYGRSINCKFVHTPGISESFEPRDTGAKQCPDGIKKTGLGTNSNVHAAFQ